MPTPSPLKISGKVVYIDGTEAAAAKVRIIEQDLAGGGNDSKVVTADADGRYELSIDWQDSEGLGLPDVEFFTFKVEIDGKAHEGPLFHNRGRAVTIVVPWPPPKPIGKTARELVQIIYVSDGYEGAERRLYEFIELSSEALTRTVLGGLYSRLTFVKGTDATLPGLVAALEAATARSGTKAVDLLFTTHGFTNEMQFADGVISDTKVADAILAIAPARLRKLRIVFSTACIGATHRDAWMKAGFTVVSGSKGTYADSAVSYLPFLSAWASGKSFAQAIDAANNADPLDAADNLAKAYYRFQGKSPRVVNGIDSERVYSGNGRTRIYSNL